MESTVETRRPNIDPMRFTEKLNRACILRRMTNQRELADLARVSKSSLNRWINGDSMPNVEEAWRLARVLDVPLEWLAADDDQETPPASPVSEEEDKILWMVRTIGTEEAVRRLALVGPEVPAPPASGVPSPEPAPAPRPRFETIAVRTLTDLDNAEDVRKDRPAAKKKGNAGAGNGGRKR